MTVVGLLRISLALLALATLAAPVQADPGCTGGIFCASEPPCLYNLCAEPQIVPCTTLVCVSVFSHCTGYVCLKAGDGPTCKPIQFGSNGPLDLQVDEQCIKDRIPPTPSSPRPLPDPPL